MKANERNRRLDEIAEILQCRDWAPTTAVNLAYRKLCQLRSDEACSFDRRASGEPTEGERLYQLLGWLQQPLENSLTEAGRCLVPAGEIRGNVEVYWRTARETVEELLALYTLRSAMRAPASDGGEGGERG